MSYVTPTTLIAGQTVTATHWNRLVDNQQNVNTRLEALEALIPGPPDFSDFPIGAVVAYFRAVATIPAGWHVCDGETYDGTVTPDLRGMFVYGSTDAGDHLGTGGAATHTHTNPNTESVSGHTHSASGSTGTSGVNNNVGSGAFPAATGSHTHTYNISTQSDGSHAHTVGNTSAGSSLPPYVKLYWITRTA
jgi:hypothetical protein